MGEWPKEMMRLPNSRWWLENDGTTGEPSPPDLDVELAEVIPADLGRELESLVRRALWGESADVWNRDARAALVRYEQEVGDA